MHSFYIFFDIVKKQPDGMDIYINHQDISTMEIDFMEAVKEVIYSCIFIQSLRNVEALKKESLDVFRVMVIDARTIKITMESHLGEYMEDLLKEINLVISKNPRISGKDLEELDYDPTCFILPRIATTRLE